MKKIISLVLVASLVHGGAMAVSDPTSYTYYVQQINAATEQINLLTQQVQTLGGIKTATDDVKRQIYKVKDDFTNAMNNLVNAQMGLANAILDTPETVDKLFSMERDSITTSPGDGGVIYEDTAAFLDDVYRKTGTMEAATWLHINDERLRRGIRKDVAQLAFRRLLFDQDDFKQRQQERIDRTTEIIEKMANDPEPSMIQTQINTATLLQELVQVQTEMLELQKAAIVAYAYTNYENVDFEKVKERLEKYKDDDPERRKKYHESRRAKTPNSDALPKNVNLDVLYGY
ncbi:MAG: hypothetical protein AB7E49_03400 [Campylobacterales bacterium]